MFYTSKDDVHNSNRVHDDCRAIDDDSDDVTLIHADRQTSHPTRSGRSFWRASRWHCTGRSWTMVSCPPGTRSRPQPPSAGCGRWRCGWRHLPRTRGSSKFRGDPSDGARCLCPGGGRTPGCDVGGSSTTSWWLRWWRCREKDRN